MARNVKNEIKEYNVLSNSKSEHLACCFLCDTIKQIDQHLNIQNKISILYEKADQFRWDTIGSSQIRNIFNFKCLVCDFSTDDFITWVKHIMSIKHMSLCHCVKNLHSFPCGACKILYYGPDTLINEHRYNTHKDKSKLSCVLKLMSEIIKGPRSRSHLYFCSYCKTFSNKHERTDHKNTILYYCEYCNVSFLCSTEVLDNHSISVEHVTLKYIFLFKKLYNTSVQHTEEHDSNRDARHIPLKLSLIILNKFLNISPFMVKCKLCNIVINQNDKEILEHTIYKCTNKSYYLSPYKNKTLIKTYYCMVCYYTTKSFSDYKIHIISIMHLTNCHNDSNAYSYFCIICNLYIYCTKDLAKIHWETHKNAYKGLPYISRFLANNFKRVSNHPDTKFINYLNNNYSSYSENLSVIQCNYCKINFCMCIEDYHLHKISSEHIILKYFTPKLPSLIMEHNAQGIEGPSQSKCQSSTKNNMIENLQELQLNKGKYKNNTNYLHFLMFSFYNLDTFDYYAEVYKKKKQLLFIQGPLEHNEKSIFFTSPILKNIKLSEFKDANKIQLINVDHDENSCRYVSI